MTARFNSEMMILARERRGMSQSALADAVSLTQATISRYESGLVSPIPDHLARIAQTLDRPEGFFFLNERLYGASSMFHRARKMSMRDEKIVHAQVNEIRIHAAVLLREAEITSKFSFHRLDRAKNTPESLAQVLRQLWQLPTGPVRSVVGAIERAGGIVFRCPFGTTKIDGVSQWPLDSDVVPPVFFVREDSPGDRQRFTLAHEIAHVVMHHLPTDDPEEDADRFASEFLLPAREIAGELANLSLQRIAALKCYWKVSMAAIIRRARDLGKMTDRQYAYYNAELAKRGYKKCEPAMIPPEEPQLFAQVIGVHQRSHGRSVEHLSHMLGMHEDQFRKTYWRIAGGGLRLAM